MLVTGFFKPFLFMIIYLLIHEFGHILIGYVLGFKVIKINIYPCGLLTIFNMKINDSIFKDFLIALSGPLFQILGYFLIKKYYGIHLFLIIFNLLPIYPLDGSKIFSDLLYIIFPYKVCNDILFFVSYIICIFILCFFIYNFNLIYILIFIVLLFKILEFYNNRKFIFNSFVMERILYNFKFLFFKKIKNINNMYKGSYHFIYNNGNYIDEDTYLNNLYKKPNFC